MHKAKACIVSCMDFRFQKKVQHFLETKHLLGAADEIIIAGGTRDFIAPVDKKDGEYVWKELELSLKLHNPDKIVFIDHQDCGGYAQDGTIPNGLNKTTDKAKHLEYFTKLKAKLNTKYPGKEVLFFYAPLTGEIEKC